jgi:hypothetical protein
MRLAAAAALYFVIVFGVGFVLGPIRVLWLEPSLGKTIAVLCETPLLLIAMILAARWVPVRVGLRTDLRPLSAMGIGAVVLQQIADFAVGVMLRDLSPGEQLANFKTPAGIVYAVSLVAFAAMPLLVNGNWTKR